MGNILAEKSRNRQVKDYICTHFCMEPEAIAQARQTSLEAGLKAIHIPENVGKTLYLLCRLIRPKKILEIGTLGGYSTLWLEKGLAIDGKILTIECQEKHAKIAEKNFVFAGVQSRIEIHLGMAADILTKLISEKQEPFELIFIDADKENYPNYLEPCLELARSGTLIISDNVIPKRGDIGSPDSRDIEALGIYAFNQKIAEHPRLESVILSTIVGEQGRVDGLGVTLVK